LVIYGIKSTPECKNKKRRVHNMRIKDLMTRDVRSLKGDMTLTDAAHLMRELDVGVIPVTGKNGDLEGVITDRDIVIRSIALGNDPGMTKIETVMTKDVITISPDTNVSEAARIMSQEKVRRLPVVEGVKLAGMISLGDLAANSQADQMAGNVLEDVSTPIGPKA
jgi:CBS domain-containing protein